MANINRVALLGDKGDVDGCATQCTHRTVIEGEVDRDGKIPLEAGGVHSARTAARQPHPT
jgi:hypothetical protein